MKEVLVAGLLGLIAGMTFVGGFYVGLGSHEPLEKQCFAMEIVEGGYHGEGVDCETGELLSGEGMFIDYETLALYDVPSLNDKRVAFYWTAQQVAQEEWGGIAKIEIEEEAK